MANDWGIRYVGGGGLVGNIPSTPPAGSPKILLKSEVCI